MAWLSLINFDNVRLMLLGASFLLVGSTFFIDYYRGGYKSTRYKEMTIDELLK